MGSSQQTQEDKEALKPGDVRPFRGRNRALVVAAGVWAERQNRWIKINLTGINQSHTYVINNPKSTAYHRILFRDIRRLLIARDNWPFGEEGAETEQPDR
jgi:hypothetical protein